LIRSLWRGLCLRCPCCNQSGLFQQAPDHPQRWWARLVPALQQVDHCAHCGEAYHQIRTDDFAPWLSILALGHLLLPAIITVERLWQPPLWGQALLWLPISVEFIRATLPRAKGAALGLMWALQIKGTEQSY
jgi:uncharacterized protein (DUF983 family)